MGVRDRVAGWGVPQYVLVGLAATLGVALLVAATTSTAAFGAYNPAWDGASQLPGEAEAAGADPTVILNASAYGSVEPNGTVAVVLSPDEPYGPADRTQLRRFVREVLESAPAPSAEAATAADGGEGELGRLLPGVNWVFPNPEFK